MFSSQSLSYLSKRDLLKFKRFKNKKNINSYIEIIKKGLIPRPHYALGILLACNQAVQIGLKKISVVEIGFYDKSSIIDLVEHKNIIESILPIKVNIIYFNINIDLFNSSKNLRDRNDFFKKLKKKNLEKIKNVKILDFKRLNKEKFNDPIGFIIFDTRNFSVTNQAFQIFKKKENFFLPKSILYFDHFYRSSEFEGEYFGINKFNKKSDFKKISDIIEMSEQLSLSWNKWLFLGKRFKYFINFKHKDFKKYISLVI